MEIEYTQSELLEKLLLDNMVLKAKIEVLGEFVISHLVQSHNSDREKLLDGYKQSFLKVGLQNLADDPKISEALKQHFRDEFGI